MTVMRAMMRHACLLVLAFLAAGLTSVAAQPSDSAQKYPNVVAVKVQSSGVDTFNFDATVSSPYDSAQRYADAFRVMGKRQPGLRRESCCTTMQTSNLSPVIYTL